MTTFVCLGEVWTQKTSLERI